MAWCARLLAVCLLLLNASAGAATNVAVLIDPSVSTNPVPALIEQHLMSRSDLKVLDRTALSSVVDEAALQRLIGDERIARVEALSRLKLADAVAVIRAAPDGGLHIVLCETRRGLRLLQLSVPKSEVREASVAVIADQLARRARLVERNDVQVWAVPPLVNQNLSFERDHLIAGLELLFEESLHRQANVLTVEMLEAQALFDEIALGKPDASRDLPYYLVGEFRHASPAPDAPMDLVIRLKHGNRAIATLRRDKVKATDLPKAVDELVVEAVMQTGLKPTGVADPVADAKLLADRAAAFSKIGNHREPLGLIESAIVLQPDDLELRRAAYGYYKTMVEVSGDPRQVRVEPSDNAELARLRMRIRYYQRGFEHWRFYVDRTLDTPDRQAELARDIHFSAYDIILRAREVTSPEARKLIEEMVSAEREQLIPLVVKDLSKNGDSVMLMLRFYFWRIDDIEPDTRVERYLAIAAKLPDDPGVAKGLRRMLGKATDMGWGNDHGPAPEVVAERLKRVEEVIRKVEQLPQKAAAAWAAELRKGVEESLQAYQHYLQHGKPKTPVPKDYPVELAKLKLEPIKIRWPAPVESYARENSVEMWVDVAPGKSLVGSRRGWLWVARNGTVRPLALPEHAAFQGFDGTRAWFFVTDAKETPQIAFVHARTEKIETYEARTVLPPYDMGVRAGILSDGRALVVGALGSNQSKRSWFAIVQYREKAPPLVDVFHEAREMEINGPATRQPLPNESFSPRSVSIVQAKDASGVERQYALVMPYRIVDVDARKVQTIPQHIGIKSSLLAEKGAVWFFQSATPAGLPGDPMRWIKLQAPDFKLQVVWDKPPIGVPRGEGELIRAGDLLVMVADRTLYVLDGPDRILQSPLPPDLPWRGLFWAQQQRQLIAATSEMNVHRLTIDLPSAGARK